MFASADHKLLQKLGEGGQKIASLQRDHQQIDITDTARVVFIFCYNLDTMS